jgi:uncharacterized protein YodC (DUF2158 family)
MAPRVKFKIGDIVQLKSGGPTMTVTEPHEYEGDLSYVCTWFAGKKNERARFPENALETPRSPEPRVAKPAPKQRP